MGNLIENLIDIYPIMGCRMFGLTVERTRVSTPVTPPQDKLLLLPGASGVSKDISKI